MLKNKDFFYMYFSRLFSILASSIMLTSILKWIEVESDSASAISWFFVFYTLPVFIFSVPAGTWVQSKNKKKIIQLSLILSTIISIVLYILMPFVDFYWAYIYITFNTLFTLILAPAERTILPKIVQKDELIKANSYFSLGELIPLLLGAVGAAKLLQNGIEAQSVFLLAIVSWFVSIIFILLLKFEEKITFIETKNIPFYKRILADVNYIKTDKNIYYYFVFFLLFWIAYSPLQDVVGINYLQSILGEGAESFGIFTSMFRIGNILVVFFIPYLYKKFEQKHFVVMTLLIYASYLFAFHIGVSFNIALYMSIIMGMFANIIAIFFINYLQETVPEDKQGSIFGFHGLLVRGIKSPLTFVLTLLITPVGVEGIIMLLMIISLGAGILAILFFPKIRR